MCEMVLKLNSSIDATDGWGILKEERAWVQDSKAGNKSILGE